MMQLSMQQATLMNPLLRSSQMLSGGVLLLLLLQSGVRKQMLMPLAGLQLAAVSREPGSQ
jgi:hypothetical protein